MAVVYRAVAATSFPPDATAALRARRLDGVLHYSRQSATIYLDCAARAGLLDEALAPWHYCLSRQIAQPLQAAGARNVRISPRPDEGALLDLIGS
jgi:uroporphyrinogen-III synthase